MKRTASSNVQLGLFVTIGLAFLLAALYLIGNNHNLFDSTFEVHATFYSVSGLTKGNNVRFSGIDVGTIRQVEIISDTSVKVTMVIENEVHPYIKKTSLVSVGTDGLMGNKLVNITNLSAAPGDVIEEGGALVTAKPVETDNMIRTLDQTNKNLNDITNDIKKITQRVKSNNSLWSILMDTTVADNLKQSIASIRITTRNTSIFTLELNQLARDLKSGKGLAGSLLSDTVSPISFRKSIRQLQEASNNALQFTSDIKVLTEKMKKGEGGAGVLMSDTAFSHDLKRSLHNIQVGTERFDENMEAMKHNFLFKGYFKRQEKEIKKQKESDSSKKIKIK